MAEFLRRHVWAVFLAHQLLIFTFAIGFLTLLRRITGRTIHGGRDPIGPIDGAALVVLSVLVMVITWALYRWVKGEDAPPLGIAPSPRRILILAGIVQSLAYVLTGNIWLTSGVHAGANAAPFSVSGLWHAGAVVSIIGRLVIRIG